MRHNIRKSNLSFMYGIIAMSIVVLLIASLFLYWCMPASQQTGNSTESTTISSFTE
ncbi:MAG: hypothetical protein II240_00025 [Bacteroidaceae bacterium]|nr:hypothetical protein [Bacteroidaceae bacterium]